MRRKESHSHFTRAPHCSHCRRTATDHLHTAALKELYEVTGGATTWTNKALWMFGDPCAVGWYGVTCHARYGNYHVTSLSLSSNSLKHYLPTVSEEMGW